MDGATAVGAAVGSFLGAAAGAVVLLLRALWWLVRRALWPLLWRALFVGAALLLLLVWRAQAARLLGLALGAAAARLAFAGREGGEGFGGERRTANAPGAPGTANGRQTSAPVVKLRPVSAQRIATAAYAETRFFTRALDGPGLLSMLVGPAGVGKSEVVWGSLRAGHDGEDFCGLATARPKRVLLLSEMGGETLQPALRRWGFYAEPAGRLDAVRWRLLPPRGGAGGLVDVLYATDIYKPVLVDGDLRVTEWPAVVEAVRGLVARGRYDKVVVDSLGEWMGADNNDSMLRTLGACRQLTAAGAGVLILHHTPRTDPKRPRGGTVIEAKLDVGYSVTGTGPGGAARSRTDPVRRLEWFKTRFPDLTPPEALTIERVLPAGGARPSYRLAGGAAAVVATVPPPITPSVAPAPNGNAAAVLAALVAAPREGATMKDLSEATGIPRNRVSEVINTVLIPAGDAVPGGYRETKGGGPKASLYRATRATRLRLVDRGGAGEGAEDAAS